MKALLLFGSLFQDAGALPAAGFNMGNMTSYLILIAVLFGVFYFFVIRPEKKKRTEMQDKINKLQAGDKVITIGGIHGSVVGVTDKTVVLRVAEQTKMEFSRQAIGTIVEPETEVVEKK